MATLVDEILKKDEKWNSLKPLFAHWTREDFGQFTADELLDLVEPHLRLQVALLIKSEIHKYLKGDGAGSSSSPRSSREPAFPPSFRGPSLDLRGKVSSIKFSGINSYSTIGNWTQAAMGLSEDVRKNVFKVDLSRNNLFDDDLPYIVDFCKLFPHCQVIDLSLNRFYGFPPPSKSAENPADTAVRKLLSLDGRRVFVVIESNPLASVDRADFFKTLISDDKEALKYLVWIPDAYFKAEKWKRIVEDPEAQDYVKEAHENIRKFSFSS